LSTFVSELTNKLKFWIDTNKVCLRWRWCKRTPKFWSFYGGSEQVIS